MSGSGVDPPEPSDPLLRVLARYWDDVLALADPEQRAKLQGLVDGTLEPDPIDARAALAEELLDLLPPGHEVVDVLLAGSMLAGSSERSVRDLWESGLRLLRASDPAAGDKAGGPAGDAAGGGPAGDAASGGPAGDTTGGTGDTAGSPGGASVGGGPRPVDAPAPADERPADERPLDERPAEERPLDEFDRLVRSRLLAMPSLAPEELRGWGGDPDDTHLIRLRDPRRGDQLPAFQFTPAGRPWPIVRQVNARLGAAADPWGVTCWWVDPHARLDTSPAALLGQGQDALLLRAAAALAED
ncbi:MULTISPECIES: hypothetical protein [Frankia]|uniref:Uncharacterized protein n=1 Tax=Frankia alni (strain DSM 45986 / CECT 9034 / ACN14a) TaxID=326424 RepID=Q0RSD6_FRAAA|nr:MULTISPECIES: hypothetical protein [Frankia]CAJ59527.1 conserved hypothetical protein [Frankia alni ACN14a]